MRLQEPDEFPAFMDGMENATLASTTGTGTPARSPRKVVAGLVALGAVCALTACTSAVGSTSSASTSAAAVSTPSETKPAAAAAPGTASAALAGLPVKGRAPMTGYSRAQFGPAWTDDTRAPLGHNGCDTRNDVLKRDLTAITFKPGHCAVASGTLLDPYTGQTIKFVRGPQASVVQIDHVAALGDAWQTGAQQLSPDVRRELANDPLNLIAASGRANDQKGDSDAASWLPANKAFRCTYVARQIAVKARYHLAVTSAEKTALGRVLAGCPKQPLPTEANALARAYEPSGSARSTPTQPPTSTEAAGTVSYANCDAVRAAGAAPLHRGDPGYSRQLDRDGDGVACE